MTSIRKFIDLGLMRITTRLIPFADAATEDLPLPRLLRLSLFQVSVGLTMVLLTGTLNRVMIVELGVPAGLVAVMVSLPLVLAPLRALIGFRSDTHRSFLGLRRLPYIAFGTMIQYGGLAIMPFALLILSGDSTAPAWVGQIAAGAAFLLAGAGLHMCQTAGLALAADLAPEEARPRVVALFYVMLLAGMVVSALVLGVLLTDITPVQLIQVVQGTAVVVMVLNTIALWKQEPRQPHLTRPDRPTTTFREAWRQMTSEQQPMRLLLVVALGTAAFSMQDVLLEPYGGEVLGLSVSATTALTGLLAGGSLIGFVLAAHSLSNGGDPNKLAAMGVMAGIVAFVLVIVSGMVESPLLFRIGTALIGFGGGLFSVGTLTGAMMQATRGHSGLALGTWGAVQATASGLAMGIGGLVRDGAANLASAGALGPVLTDPTVGYTIVYHIEIILLFTALAVIGPLYKRAFDDEVPDKQRFGLSEIPS
ncbi:MAG: BCD family MFS transporter [Hyphomicrobiaceae bacterium]|jgi:BCD family chlorophyll transporter-like MFS transporter